MGNEKNMRADRRRGRRRKDVRGKENTRTEQSKRKVLINQD